MHTAGEGILAGTVRRLLLEVCEREGIPVVLQPPNLKVRRRQKRSHAQATSRAHR